jgi:hypothetical protein
MQNTKDVVIVFKSNGLGETKAQELKEKLSQSFLGLLSEVDPLPRAMCFYTEGVKLACEGSTVLEHLRVLEGRGVRLILCTTCLNYFGLTDKVRVGIPGGMGDIIAAMLSADSVLTM